MLYLIILTFFGRVLLLIFLIVPYFTIIFVFNILFLTLIVFVQHTI